MAEIRSAQEELSKTFGEAGQSFYAQNQAAPEGAAAGDAAAGGTADAGSTKPADDVVEADYEIVDDKK